MRRKNLRDFCVVARKFLFEISMHRPKTPIVLIVENDMLLKSEIPIFMVCGDSDTVVPYKENGKILLDYFKENNGNLTEIVKAGCDHHPHGFEDYLTLFDFVKKYY